MEQKLRDCFFYRRCTTPTVEVQGSRVMFSFEKDISRQELAKKCLQTFKHYGRFTSYTLEKQVAAAAAAAAPAAPAAAPAAPAAAPAAAPETLARRSTVEDIKRLADGLTNAETHSLAVFFACRYVHQPQPWTALVQLMAAKRAAAAAFNRPADEWDRLLTECAPLHDAACALCRAHTSQLLGCRGCERFCCARCIPIEVSAKCRACTGSPQLSVALAPPQRVPGLEWYFHHPLEGPFKLEPKRCLAENRDTRHDPRLHAVVEVRKNFRLEKVGRLARPPGWASAFTVIVVLEGADGTQRTLGINMAAFNMNAAWRAHPAMIWVKDEWMADPRNYDKVGPVLNMPEPVYSAPPSPPSPVIEELEDEVGELRPAELEESRQELQRLEAALPGSDDDSPLRLPKRRRVSADEAARFYDATNYFRR